MSNQVIAVNDQTFMEAVQQGTVLVDFWAPWCGPCRMQLPILEQVAEQVGRGAKVLKVNVDECPELAAKYQVHSIPTLILFKNGSIIRRWVGVQNATTLIAAINQVG